MLAHMFRYWHSLLTDQPCIGCQQVRVTQGVCVDCFSVLERLDHLCQQCARPLGQQSWCGYCAIDPPEFDRCHPCFHYGYPIMSWLQACKYQKRMDLAYVLADCMIAAWADEHTPTGIDVLIPMPMSPSKRTQRGFNVAEILGEQLAHHWGILWSAKLVTRQDRQTQQAQAGLNLEDRQRNIQGVFQASDALQGTAVGVVDDVLTTGATFSELTRTLREVGVDWVEGWILARA